MTPRFLQFLCGAAVILGGAYLIGRWALGIGIVLIGIFLLVDGLLRNAPEQQPRIDDDFIDNSRLNGPLKEASVEDILERARRRV